MDGTDGMTPMNAPQPARMTARPSTRTANSPYRPWTIFGST
jgi:hypothetical protein